METNNGTDFVGSKSRMLKLKSLKTRDDMSGVDHEEDYHTGVPVSVPFIWESEPGTPKNKDKDKYMDKDNDNDKDKDKDKFADDGGGLSPLTPPPSYFSPSPRHRHSLRNNSKSSSRTNFLNTVFRKLSVKAASLQPPSLPSSSSSSSTSSLSSSTMTTPTSSRRERGRAGSPRRLSFEWKLDDQEEEEEEEEETNNEESPVSTLFFGRRVNGQGCCPKLVKVFTRDVN